MRKTKRRSAVTGRLIESIALDLRRTTISRARARALAPGIERVTDAALAAADGTDFNDEPARFSSVLADLKSPKPKR
jgi:hypothetical protein